MGALKRKLVRGHSGPLFGKISLLIFALVIFWTHSLAAAESWKWPKQLIIGAPGIGTSSQLQVASWTPVLEKMTGMRVRVVPENSAASRAKWLRQGRIDIETEALASFTGEAMEGRKGNASREGGPFQTRIVWITQVIPFGYMVRGDSDIQTIYDLKKGKKRFAICTPISGAVRSIEGLLAWLELKKEDVTIVPFGSWKANVLSVAEGKADVAMTSITSAATFEAASNPKGIRILPLPYKQDRHGAERLLNVRPTVVFGTVRDGVKEGIGVPSFHLAFCYYARADMPKDLVYNLAKWLDENYEAYKDTYKMNKHMKIDTLRETLDVIFHPIHDGTIEYLKQKGMWTSADDARQEDNLRLLSRYVNAYKAAIAEADKKGIKVDPTNNDWMNLWGEFKKDIPRFKVKLN